MSTKLSVHISAFNSDIYQAENTFIRLKEIPYYNSPKQAIGYLEQKYHESVDEYSSFINTRKR